MRSSIRVLWMVGMLAAAVALFGCSSDNNNTNNTNTTNDGGTDTKTNEVNPDATEEDAEPDTVEPDMVVPDTVEPDMEPDTVEPDATIPGAAIGEWCNTMACKPDLKCVAGMCHKSCDPANGMDGNPDCPADYWCDDALGTIPLCRKKCDASKGRATNADCAPGTHCELSMRYDPGYCALTAQPPKAGTKQLGEDCTDGYPATDHCDSAANLFCHDQNRTAMDFFLYMPTLCAKACDPRAATPDCPAGQACEEDVYSFLQGRCVPEPSKQLDEQCNNADLRCVAGLTCIESICRTVCDETKGITDNPDCGADAAKYYCYAALAGSGCIEKCDPADGNVNNPNCPANRKCQQDWSDEEDYAPGYCIGLDLPRVGLKKVGEACGSKKKSMYCEAGLACVDNKCLTACDPKSATAQCGTDEACHEAPWLYPGGFCAPVAGTKALAERCNETDQRCAEGLTCFDTCETICVDDIDCGEGNWCLLTMTQTGLAKRFCNSGCDPADGLFGNPACRPGGMCLEFIPDVMAFCIEDTPPPLGTGQAGDPCNEADTCDGANGLVCDLWSESASNRCVKKCDQANGPVNNPDCATGEMCDMGTGFCLDPATLTQELNDPCDGAKRCKDGLTCISNRCFKNCDIEQGTDNNPDCDAGDTCFEWGNEWELYGTVCRQSCESTEGQIPNPACPAGMGCKTVDPESLGTGTCTPTAKAEDGNGKLGDPCGGNDDISTLCGAGLVCSEIFVCETACDPTATTGCPQGQTCVGSWYSVTGGYCL